MVTCTATSAPISPPWSQTALRVADPKDFDLTLPAAAGRGVGADLPALPGPPADPQRRPPPPPPQRRHQPRRPRQRRRWHLRDTGEPVSPIALAVLKCDAAYHRLLFSAVSGIIDYGRGTRDWPVDVYNAIALRDAGCRIGACDAPQSWCDVHHVVPWENGGETSVTNGAMACRRHHRLVHTPGYTSSCYPTAPSSSPTPTAESTSASPAARCPNTSGDNPPAAEPAAPHEPSPTGPLQRVRRLSRGAGTARVSRHHSVELEGIEPSSVERLPAALRPFPCLRLYGCRPAGSGEHARCSPPGLSPRSAVFHAVSGLSLPSSTASVAGLRWTGPVCRHWSLLLSFT